MVLRPPQNTIEATDDQGNEKPNPSSAAAAMAMIGAGPVARISKASAIDAMPM